MRKKLAWISALLMILSGCNMGNIHLPENSGSDTVSDTTAVTETATVTETSALTATASETATETAAASETTTVQDSAAATAVSSTEVSDSFTEENDPTAIANQNLESARDVIRGNGCIVGAAFVGYIDSELPETGIREFLKNSETFNIYTYLNTASLVCREGAEMYALTPLEGYSITVYPTELTEEGENIADRIAPLYQGEIGESIVLRCNLSEIYSNVLISVTNGSETVEFQPMLSMKDGHMITTDKCQDLSMYGYTWESFVNYAYESLLSNYEIQGYVEQGMTLRCTDEIVDVLDGQQGLLFALGTDREDQFVSERFYAVGVENGNGTEESLKFCMDPATGEWKLLPEG